MSNRVGQQIGNYRLVRLLGQGAFAEVYLGEHIYLKSYAALKVLLTFLEDKDEERFLSEAQTLAGLVHPHIVRVHDYAVEFGTPVLVMDYAPSGTLRQRYPRGSCLSLETTVAYVKQVAAALQYAHNHNVIHRDVKPENILLGVKQDLLLGDFGISLLAPSPEQLRSQDMAGTIPYMAPEQILGRPSFASDQYALGILVYEWLCGARPFEGSFWQIAEQHRSASPPPLREKDPSLPQAIEDVVLRTLAKDPQQRYVSVQQFAWALERVSQESERSYRYASEKTALLPPLSPPTRQATRRTFLSASRADEAFVERLTDDLELRDIVVEHEYLESVSSMSDQGDSARRAIRAAQIVFLVASPQANSSRAVKDHLRVAGMYKRRVVAVWAAGEKQTEVLLHLEQTTKLIDARNGCYKQALDEMLACLESERSSVSSPSEPLPSEPRGEPRNPYKGLHAFRPEDAEDFFGRELLIRELLKKVEEVLVPQQPDQPAEGLLAVIGASGSGKSSVVMAGLLPRLQKGVLPGSKEWVYLKPMVPGTDPLEALTLTLASHMPEKNVQSIREILHDDSARGLHLLTADLVKEPKQKVVLMIDQFEELFHLTHSEDERQRFIDLLLTAVTQPQGSVIVILTLRADFYDRPLSYPELGELILRHQTVVLPMGIQDLRAAITQPAALPDVQLTFEGSLVGDLLFEVQGQIGALPLLQFTLDQLFERRKDHILTLQVYSEIGGVKGALARQAEDTYMALPSEEHRRLARTLFLRLIDPGATEQDTTRRRAALTEFSLSTPEETEIAQQVITAFLAARLLTTDESVGTSTIEVSHEALIREWKRLADWLYEAREDVHLQQTISRDVTEWEQHNMVKDRLYRGSLLKVAEDWAKRNVPSQKEAAFLKASASQRTMSLVRLIAVALVLLSAFGVAGWFAFTLPPNPTLVTTLQDNVKGSLRYCIDNAPSGSTITFAQYLKGVIKLTGGDLTFAGGKQFTLRGPGADQITISGGTANAFIKVSEGAGLNISNLSFKNSQTVIYGFIQNAGTLTITNSIISNNEEIAGDHGYGAGIYNYKTGILSVSNSTISGNKIIGQNSGQGAGIDNEGKLTVTNTTISNNSASSSSSYNSGGGITNTVTGTILLVGSTISHNSANSSSNTVVGGGIDNYGKMTVTNSTISNNSISTSGTNNGFGGGIINETAGTLSITNSTISHNSASTKTGSFGGGIHNQGKLTVNHSSILNNSVSSPSDNNYGGGIHNISTGTISLTNSTISNNLASSSNDNGEGGGIDNHGKMTVTNSTISNNSVSGPGSSGFGGGIFNDTASTISLIGSTISNNLNSSKGADSIGGGIDNQGELTVTNSTISNNTSVGNLGYGGAIYNYTAGTIWLTDSTISNNLASSSTISNNLASSSGGEGAGGGIDNGGNLTVINSTIVGNKAVGKILNIIGGGIFSEVFHKGTFAVIRFSTIYGNAAGTGGGIWIDPTGSSNLTISSSIVAANSAQIAPGISGTMISGGYNLLQNFAGATGPDVTTDRQVDLASLKINPTLSNNGGLTQTLEVLSGSPAIDAVPDQACSIIFTDVSGHSVTVTTDQRGDPRPDGSEGTCDIGAYESSY